MSYQHTFAKALLNPELGCPKELKTWNGSNPEARFAVYRNNVVVSLIDALADTFPVTQELVGEEFFRAMARDYVQNHPPRSRLLALSGNAFPDFADTFAPAAAVPYLSDVARLEMSRARAYHAADTPSINPDTLRAALTEPDQLLTLRLMLHPSVHLIDSRFAIFSLWAAHQGALCISTVDPSEAQAVLVFRNGLDVDTVELTREVSLLIKAIQKGESLVSAADAASRAGPDFDLADALATLLRLQLITHIATGERNP